MSDDILHFEIRNGDVVQDGANWVYIWTRASQPEQIIRIGSTWLHPAARAAKHVAESDPGPTRVLAVKVPGDIDRGRVRDILAKDLKSLGRLAPDAVVGSTDKSFEERIQVPESQIERTFVASIIKRLAQGTRYSNRGSDLVVIFGPPAVGKMTVGQALAARTGMKLFHNHMTIDLLTKIFPFGSKPFRVLCDEFRRRVIEEAALSSIPNGLIFTYVWALDDPSDKRVMDEYKAIVEGGGGRVFFVELQANLEERLVRNRSENRLAHKNKSKVEKTEETIRDWEGRFQMNTSGDFFYRDRYLKIDNTSLAADEVAASITQTFGFDTLDQVQDV